MGFVPNSKAPFPSLRCCQLQFCQNMLFFCFLAHLTHCCSCPISSPSSHVIPPTVITSLLSLLSLTLRVEAAILLLKRCRLWKLYVSLLASFPCPILPCRLWHPDTKNNPYNIQLFLSNWIHGRELV